MKRHSFGEWRFFFAQHTLMMIGTDVELELHGRFIQPLWLDLAATFLYALVGASRAIRKGYDVIGVFVLALLASRGGGLIRDVLLQQGAPITFRDYRFLAMAWTAALLAVWLYKHVPRLRPYLTVVDSVALGIYAVVGAQMTLLAGLSPLAAIFIGLLNAIGGGLLLALFMREEPEVFMPGMYHAVAAFCGLVVFIVEVLVFQLDARIAAPVAIAVTATVRTLALRNGWQTKAIMGPL
jgi:uncharacterized membrane protein YeiH